MKKLLLAFFLLVAVAGFAQNPIQYLLVGTYTNNTKSDGIYVYRYNPNKNEATLVSSTKDVSNPSFLVVSNDQKYVYAVNEDHGDNGGSVSAFALDKTKGQLVLLNKVPSGGDDPAHIAIDSTGKYVIVANYSGGNISVFKTNPDGSLSNAVQTIAHEGYGVNVQRQEMPHPHCIMFSPDQKFVFVADLGNDRLYRYKFDLNDAAAPLKPTDPLYTTVPDNFGPRHLVFNPNGKVLYLLGELAGQIIVYSYNPADGSVAEIQTIASDNSNVKGDKGSAEIDITKDGRFLYTSNRGTTNDITMFKAATDGKLAENGHVAVGAHPRNFMIDPSSRFLLVAGRDANTIQIFIINKNFGLLQDSNEKIAVPQPVCLKMVPVK